MLQKLRNKWQGIWLPYRLTGIFIVLLFSTTAFLIINRDPNTNNSINKTVTSQPQTVETSVSGEWQTSSPVDAQFNQHRVYEDKSISRYAKTKNIYLVDGNGKTVRTDKISASAGIKTVLADDSFLMQDFDFNDDLTYNYYHYSPDGLEIVEPPEGLMDGSFGRTEMFAIGGNEVVFIRVINPGIFEEEYEAELVRWDVSSGKEEVISNQQIQDYQARIASVSPDGKYLYLLGVSPRSQDEYTKKYEELTGGGIFFESDPEIEKSYDWEIEYTLIQYEIAQNKAVATRRVTLENTWNAKYYVSPTGEHIFYEDKETSSLRIVDTATNKRSTINSQEYPGIEPIDTINSAGFSQNGKYLTLVVGGKSNDKYGSLINVLELDTNQLQLLEFEPMKLSERNAAENEYSYEYHRWFGDDQLEFSKFDLVRRYSDSSDGMVSKSNIPKVMTPIIAIPGG